MIYIYCDTCVLINLATDIKLYDVIVTLVKLSDERKIKIIVSDVVKKEMNNQKDTIVGKRISSYNGHLKNFKHLYELFSKENKEILKNEIQSIQKNLPKMKEVLNKNLTELMILIAKSSEVSYTENLKSKVIERAINKTFPFHRNKNSIKDALIAETFIDFIENTPGDSEKIYFITDNTYDFSDVSNNLLPHPDWAKYFNDNIIYSTNIATVINSIEPKSIDAEIEEEIKEKSKNTCSINGSHHFETENGFWKNSMYGGGLSWHYRCTKCGFTYDTGEYYD